MSNSPLRLISNYHSDPARKQAYLEFTPRALYGASFAEWDARGCWNDNYQAYSLFEDSGRIISNVSVSIMDLFIDGAEKRGVQFSAVGTLPEFYKQGHSRRLMETVLADFDATADLFFLFANDSVLDFYTKFGFRPVREHLFRADFPNTRASAAAATRTLNMAADEDWQLLRKLAERRAPLTRRFGSPGYEHILYFYAILAYGDSILYWPEREIALFYEIEERVLRLYDLVFPKDAGQIALGEILPAMLGNACDEIMFYFTPELFDLEYEAADVYDESPLFVRGDFPLQDESGNGPPFKFPALGQT